MQSKLKATFTWQYFIGIFVSICETKPRVEPTHRKCIIKRCVLDKYWSKMNTAMWKWQYCCMLNISLYTFTVTRSTSYRIGFLACQQITLDGCFPLVKKKKNVKKPQKNKKLGPPRFYPCLCDTHMTRRSPHNYTYGVSSSYA